MNNPLSEHQRNVLKAIEDLNEGANRTQRLAQLLRTHGRTDIAREVEHETNDYPARLRDLLAMLGRTA